MGDDLISRKAAVDAIEEYSDRLQVVNWQENPGVPYKAYALNWAVNTIRDLPSAQPERKKGKWKLKTINTFELAYGSTGYEPVYECSVCGGVEESYLRLDEPIMPEDADFPNFCPNCGAEMVKGEADGQH